MKRALAVAAAALLLPATAAAKGPDRASITGPGLGAPLVVRGDGEGTTDTMLGALTSEAGFFPAVFGQSPDPMLAHRPAGDLGPRYLVVYHVPAPDEAGGPQTIRQDLYPYAQDEPVSYTKPGQRIFYGGKSHGGWYAGLPYLKQRLVRAGLPPTPPGGGGDSGLPGYAIALLVALGAVLVLAAGATVVARRRPGPAPAA